MTRPIEQLIERMTRMAVELEAAHDDRVYFHATYLRTTVAVHEEIDRGGFLDADWAEKWDIEFANLYLEAMDSWDQTGSANGPWEIAFSATRGPRIPPLRHVLLGINAHVNFDLPQALLAVISDDEFDDPEVINRRGADHERVDAVLVRRVPEEDLELQKVEQPGDRTWVDRAMQPFNRAGTKRFLREARQKVWANAHTLSSARRMGEDSYASNIEELGALSAGRVADLVTPRYVIIRLARHGFGVELVDR